MLDPDPVENTVISASNFTTNSYPPHPNLSFSIALGEMLRIPGRRRGPLVARSPPGVPGLLLQDPRGELQRV